MDQVTADWNRWSVIRTIYLGVSLTKLYIIQNISRMRAVRIFSMFKNSLRMFLRYCLRAILAIAISYGISDLTSSPDKKGPYENFSITRLIDNLQWDSLKDRRDRAKLCMAFKILNCSVILPPMSYHKLSAAKQDPAMNLTLGPWINSMNQELGY